MDEYAIHMHSGLTIWTGGFDNIQSLLWSIQHQWGHRCADTQTWSPGITVAFTPPNGPQRQQSHLALIDPSRIEAVADLREGVT